MTSQQLLELRIAKEEETIEQKIARLIKVPPIFNWVQHIFLRADDTKRSLEHLARSPIGRSLRSTYRICQELAYREIDFEGAKDQIENRLQGYSQEVASEIVPVFYDELVARQFDTVPDFKSDTFPFPIGRAVDGTTLTIPVSPNFVAIEGRNLLPVFILGWRNSDLKIHRMRLISAIIKRSVLTWQEFHGADALVLTFGVDKWSKGRRAKSWRVSQYGDMADEELQSHIDRYSFALQEVIDELRASGES